MWDSHPSEQFVLLLPVFNWSALPRWNHSLVSANPRLSKLSIHEPGLLCSITCIIPQCVRQPQEDIYSTNLVVSVVLEQPRTLVVWSTTPPCYFWTRGKVKLNIVMSWWYLSLLWNLLCKQPISQSDQWHRIYVRSWWPFNQQTDDFLCMSDLRLVDVKLKWSENILQHGSTGRNTYQSLCFHSLHYKDFLSATVQLVHSSFSVCFCLFC